LLYKCWMAGASTAVLSKFDLSCEKLEASQWRDVMAAAWCSQFRETVDKASWKACRLVVQSPWSWHMGRYGHCTLTVKHWDRWQHTSPVLFRGVLWTLCTISMMTRSDLIYCAHVCNFDRATRLKDGICCKFYLLWDVDFDVLYWWISSTVFTVHVHFIVAITYV